jgi:hypothetical protein
MQKYPIGFKFTWGQGKKTPRKSTVVDFLTTTNAAGNAVKERYIVEYLFLGQTVRDSEVVQTTIDRNANSIM